MKVTLAQLNPVIGDFIYSMTCFVDAMDKAVSDGSDLLVFPELSAMGYPAQDLLCEEDFIVQQYRFLDDLIQKSIDYKGLGMLVGVAKRCERGLLNAVMLIYEGSCLFDTAKTLLPSYDVFDEARYFVPCDNVVVCDFKQEKLAITICEDIWIENFDESPLHLLMEQSPTLLINVSASPFHVHKRMWRVKRVQKIVKRYQIPVIVVNQVGAQDELIFDGGSFVVNKGGDCMLQLPDFDVAVETIDLQVTASQDFGFKTEQESLVLALVLGINDYFCKTGFKTAVLGLSGGIDSAVCYVLACLALGKDNVTPVMMPSPFTSEQSVRDAQLMADFQGVSLEQFSISDVYKSCQVSLSSFLDPSDTTLTHENIQARLRGVFLMAFSNQRNALVLSTGNKSELAMGYSTLYGDMCGALSVIGDLSKGQVYDVARYLNDCNPDCIPEYVITRPPSAELRPNQTDQDSLPDYDVVDSCVDDMVVKKQLVGHSDKEMLRRVRINEYKRKQAPLILRVSEQSFGSGRRFPVAAVYS